jgi:hypothetical protein
VFVFVPITEKCCWHLVGGKLGYKKLDIWQCYVGKSCMANKHLICCWFL